MAHCPFRLETAAAWLAGTEDTMQVNTPPSTPPQAPCSDKSSTAKHPVGKEQLVLTELPQSQPIHQEK